MPLCVQWIVLHWLVVDNSQNVMMTEQAVCPTVGDRLMNGAREYVFLQACIHPYIKHVCTYIPTSIYTYLDKTDVSVYL